MEHRITVMFSIVIVAFSWSESLPAEHSKAAGETSYGINSPSLATTVLSAMLPNRNHIVRSQLLRLLCASLAPEVVERYCNVFNSSRSYA